MGYALLIDDDEALVGSVSRAVAFADLALDTALSWDDGLSLFLALGPNLVIADYHMRGSRHGLQLLAEVKRLRPSVKVVLVSAYFNDGDVAEIMSLGLVDAALRKLDLVGTSEAIVALIAEAASHAAVPTDWTEVAHSHVRGCRGSCASAFGCQAEVRRLRRSLLCAAHMNPFVMSGSRS